MKQALSILIGYLTCEDPTVKTKWANLLASFWHKDEGKIVTSITTATNGDVTIEIKDGAGNSETTTIPKVQLPTSYDISFINGLQDALNGKVDQVPGKGLSTHDFTTALKQKLEALQNYVHPSEHTIGEVSGLQAELDQIEQDLNAKVDAVSGKQLSDENYTAAEKQKLADLYQPDEDALKTNKATENNSNANSLSFKPINALYTFGNYGQSTGSLEIISPIKYINDRMFVTLEIDLISIYPNGMEVKPETTKVMVYAFIDSFGVRSAFARTFGGSDFKITIGTTTDKKLRIYLGEPTHVWGGYTTISVTNVIIGKDDDDDVSFETFKTGYQISSVSSLPTFVYSHVIATPSIVKFSIKDHLNTTKFSGSEISFGEGFEIDALNNRIKLKALSSFENRNIATFYDDSNVTNQYYHIKLPYTTADIKRYHLRVIGSSNGARTAIDITFMGMIFATNGIRNASETIVHNTTESGYGVLEAGVYIENVNNHAVVYFKLSNSNLT